MNLLTYLTTHETQSGLAKKLGVATVSVHQWAHGVRPVPVGRCLPIERATGGMVTRQELRPNDYWLIWPDLEYKAAA